VVAWYDCETGTGVRRGRPFGRASAVGWKKNKFIVFPLELAAGIGIVLWMAANGVVKSFSLPKDWKRYKKIRSI
jgi:hypothetical protein